uniref:DNA damageinducible protein 1 putative n=1 Tax=Albugo laibachii Nc14 TaxID=890382 RepID=F0W205_9STRA|nr:DNA damageinducible protein 1 putative [Albugo laibachii Nc14]|eukprot:CCA15084.1 DNA damageinducible protein 1 putative [Albugo laibachii Nc14]
MTYLRLVRTMQLTFASSQSDHAEQMQVDPQQTIGSFLPQLAQKFSIPAHEINIQHKGADLAHTATFQSCGVQSDDLLIIERKLPSLLDTSAPFVAREGMQFHEIPRNVSPEVLIDIFEKNTQLLPQLRQGNKDLATALEHKCIAEVRMVLMQMHMQEATRRYKEHEETLALERNPFDAQAQAKIEESIRLRNVQHNMEIAMEQMPEAFAHVYMLYIPCEVNNVQVQAFVDSGAQSTIMSSSCAERCGIMKLVDKRFEGKAVGVGTAKIIGRVHMAPLKIGSFFYNCSFTILEEQSVDFLFGLDMLKRHQCCIDLHKNVLRLHEASGFHEVEFLPEHKLSANKINASEGVNATEGQMSISETQQNSHVASEQQSRENAIQQLISFGFERQSVIQALESAEWNAEVAAGLLFESNNA